MAKEAFEQERQFIKTASEKTGQSVDEWMATIKASGNNKTNAIIKWLKSDHSLNHMQASILAGIYLNDGQPVFIPEVLFRKLFDGKENQLPVYETLEARIKSANSSVLFIPTKTYVSLEDDRVFGCVKINKSNLRVGLDLGNQPFDDYLQPAKGLGAMPNIGHMIEITSDADITDRLVNAVNQAYKKAHQ